MFLRVFQVISFIYVVGATALESTVIKNLTIYAYGPGISGLPVGVGSDGKAIISAALDTEDASAITWNIETDGSSPWNVTSNSTQAPITSEAIFYIVTTSDSFTAAGFLNTTSEAPSGAVTDGFALYGSDVMYVSNDKLLSQFWASPTTSNDTFELRWNANGKKIDDAVPVNLKPTAPPNLSRER